MNNQVKPELQTLTRPVPVFLTNIGAQLLKLALNSSLKQTKNIIYYVDTIKQIVDVQ